MVSPVSYKTSFSTSDLGLSKGYSYGFQGQELDNETGLVNYTFRMHDARVGRFFAVDPLAAKYAHYTPYSFSGNKLINAIELEGLEESELSGVDYWNCLAFNFNDRIETGVQETLSDVGEATVKYGTPILIGAATVAITVATGGTSALATYLIMSGTMSMVGGTMNVAANLAGSDETFPTSFPQLATGAVTYMINGEEYTKQIEAFCSIVEGVLTLNTKSLSTLVTNVKNITNGELVADAITILNISLTVGEIPLNSDGVTGVLNSTEENNTFVPVASSTAVDLGPIFEPVSDDSKSDDNSSGSTNKSTNSDSSGT